MEKLFTPIDKIDPIIIDASEPYPKGTKYYIVAGRECVNGYIKDKINEFLAVKVLLYINGKLVPNKSVAINVNSNDGDKITSAIKEMEDELTIYKSKHKKVLISQINSKAEMSFKYISFYGRYILKKEITNYINENGKNSENEFIRSFFKKINNSKYFKMGKKYNYNIKIYFLDNSRKYFVLNEIKLLNEEDDVLISENNYYTADEFIEIYSNYNEFVFNKEDFFTMYYYKNSIPEENIEENLVMKLL